MKSNRRDFIKASSLLSAGLMMGFKTNMPEKTLVNLKAAYMGEATTEEKYNKFALKAKEENFPKLAVMLKAIAKAERIHAINHRIVLDKLGGKWDGSPLGKYEVKSTMENIKNGYNGESYEIETMYPNFIKQAKTDNVPEAVNSFTWAYKVEIQHQGYYFLAMTALGNKSELTLPEKWYVCPKCGGTYAVADLKKTCYFDPTPKEQFFEFM